MKNGKNTTTANAATELKETKQILKTVSGMITAQEKVRKKYKCSPYDEDFPLDKIKDSIGCRNVAMIKDIIAQAENTTPEFISGLLIPRRLLNDFYDIFDSMCQSVINEEKHRYCEMQQFKASQESIGATISAILNTTDKDGK